MLRTVKSKENTTTVLYRATMAESVADFNLCECFIEGYGPDRNEARFACGYRDANVHHFYGFRLDKGQEGS
jgi:hypothetical protein